MSRSPLPCPLPTFLVALLLPPWGCMKVLPVSTLGHFSGTWNAQAVLDGEGPMRLLHRNNARGHPGPRPTTPVTVSQKAGVPLCRLSLDQSDPPRLSRDKLSAGQRMRSGAHVLKPGSRCPAPRGHNTCHRGLGAAGLWEYCFPPPTLFFVGPCDHPWAAQWT